MATEQDYYDSLPTENGGPSYNEQQGGGSSKSKPKRKSDKEYYEDYYRDLLGQLSGQAYTDSNGTAWEAYDSNPTPGFVDDDPLSALAFQRLGPSGMANAHSSKASKQAQKSALQGFEDIYEQGGLTAIDRARIADARAQEDQYVRAQRGAVQADLAERGLLGSGLEMLGRMDAAQDAGQRLSTAGLETSALGLQRRDAALAGMGDLGTTMRDQSWDESKSRAEAQDAIDALNWEATNKATTAVWEMEEDRKRRKTDRLTDHGWGTYDARQGDIDRRVQIAGAGAGLDLGYKSNDRANDQFEHQKKQDKIGNIYQGIESFGRFL